MSSVCRGCPQLGTGNLLPYPGSLGPKLLYTRLLLMIVLLATAIVKGNIMATPTIDAMILGALHEHPMSAYEINKMMDQRGVRS